MPRFDFNLTFDTGLRQARPSGTHFLRSKNHVTRQEAKKTVLNFLILPSILVITIGIYLLVVSIVEAITQPSMHTDELGGGGAGIAVVGGLLAILFFLPAFVWWNIRMVRTISKFKAKKIRGLHIGILVLPYAATAVALLPTLIKDKIDASKNKAKTINSKFLELNPGSVEYSNIVSLDSAQKVSPLLETRFDRESNRLFVMNSINDRNEYFEGIYGYNTSIPSLRYYFFNVTDSVYFRVVFPNNQKTDFQRYLYIAAFSKNSFVYKIDLTDYKLDLDFLFGFQPEFFCHKSNFYLVWKNRVFKLPLKK